MNEYAIESFISFCDDMTIVEESARTINKLYKNLLKDIERVNTEIKNEDDISKIIVLFKKKKELTVRVKSQISKESESGIDDIGLYLKNLILPAVFAILTTMVATDKKNMMGLSKGDKILALGTFSTITALTGIGSASDIKKIKMTKSNIIKLLDESIDKIDEAINVYKYALQSGFYKRSEISDNASNSSMSVIKNSIDNEIRKVNQSVKRKQMMTLISKWNIKPVTQKGNNKNNDIDFMGEDIIKFMKKYIASSEFKKKYAKYLYMIDIKLTDYSDPFSITFTDYQSGFDYDNDDDNNDWYYEFMDICEMYIKYRFENWKGYIWNSISTGDGDEGTLYVET